MHGAEQDKTKLCIFSFSSVLKHFGTCRLVPSSCTSAPRNTREAGISSTYLRIRFQLTIDIDTLNEYRMAELKFPLFFFSTWIFLISLQCIGCDSIGDFILLWCNSTFHCLRVSYFNKIKTHKYGSQVLLILWIDILLFGRQLDKKYALIFTFTVSEHEYHTPRLRYFCFSKSGAFLLEGRGNPKGGA